MSHLHSRQKSVLSVILSYLVYLAASCGKSSRNLPQEKSALHCVYQADDCCDGYDISEYQNGKYLLDCDEFECTTTYFKCPRYYCVPWRAVCNGVFDCPSGTDEGACGNRTSCPGQFKCHNSSICISPDNICDDAIDCILSDDEYFCKPERHPCPENCTCIILCDYKLQCLGDEYWCDRKTATPHRGCKDGTDEQEQVCKHWQCHPDYWKCADGLQCTAKHSRTDICVTGLLIFHIQTVNNSITYHTMWYAI